MASWSTYSDNSHTTMKQTGLAHGRSSLLPIVTSPPWAKDEPPSPTDEEEDIMGGAPRPSGVSQSDKASMNSRYLHPGASHTSSGWRTFVKRTPGSSSLAENTHYMSSSNQLAASPSSAFKVSPRRVLDRSLSWLPSSSYPGFGRPRNHFTLAAENILPEGDGIVSRPPVAATTLIQARSLGWDIPYAENEYSSSEPVSEKPTTRRTRLRHFLLNNIFVPMLFRFINFILTTTALGIAIRIRKVEKQTNLEGALGSSPTLVVIFAPVTLVHVMVNLYLEYFGRPLGLWKTSRKLAQTLMEVLFICLWAAAFSLCIDNYFTSVIPCTSVSSTAWYSALPRPPSVQEDSIGGEMCDDQAGLICLVGLGLAMYCVSLVISLLRIFEKMKYHPGSTRRHDA